MHVRVASWEHEREQWMVELQAGESVSELAARYQVSRKTLYKWQERYKDFGLEGLRDLSRAALHHPQAVTELWCERIRGARQRHPNWGAPKLRWELEQRYGPQAPSVSTIGRVLQGSGLSRPKRRMRAHGTGPLQAARSANEVWAIDFKGWWRTLDGARCEPLTVTDQASRYLLCCQAMPSTASDPVRARIERVFEQYGLPQRMRSDNGGPFGQRGACGLSRLSVWWLELGIDLERIDPGCPQQNGSHERMHLTLSQEVAQQPAATLRIQQKRLDLFRQEYNEQRPHQALGQQLPASFYQPSSKLYPRHIAEPDYPPHWRQRTIFAGGKFQWQRSHRAFVSHALVNKRVGFEPQGDGVWKVWFYRHLLGHWDERNLRFQHGQPWKQNTEGGIA